MIVLNGGSSSGKSSIARRLQEVLPDPWLTLGVDTLIAALPAALRGSDGGSGGAAPGADGEAGPGSGGGPGVSADGPAGPAGAGVGIGGLEGGDGTVSVGPAFAVLDAAWTLGVAAMARAGARIVVDEVFLGTTASQQRWREALDGLDVLWVGVRCAPEVAAARERARGDRVTGMAEAQAEAVHRGVRYDLEVDTAVHDAAACARLIADRARA
ncbi:chloramphenicol phosphotransferase CPT family protein, partial [Kitasatospora sp. NPDC057500]|uniref:chloramphenicol phosphotransferase CPT family protein n=1 Tax=Kitasatospora sp. NPDC057500 TaxID=3346151 RepID=UPI0036869B1B